MQIAVFDTNVLLDLFVFNDFRAIHLKQALLDKKIDAIATPRTLEEFADVLSRPLFSLTTVDQKKILQQWTSLARILDDKNIVQSPWKCQDPDDQVFLDLAYTARPCSLISKDNEVLKFANTALTDGVLITANYQALEF
jgi:putative PIN family toxin of toxin-antitoxin system